MNLDPDPDPIYRPREKCTVKNVKPYTFLRVRGGEGGEKALHSAYSVHLTLLKALKGTQD